MTVRSSILAAALFASLLTGCASAPQPISLSAEWPAEVGDYDDVNRKWTRRSRTIDGPDDRGRTFEQTLEVVATFKSPEWRAAYVKNRARYHKLPPSEVAALTASEKADAAKNYEVMLLVSTYDRRLNELQKGKRSVWRVALVDAAGTEIVASEIRRDRRPRTEIAAEFPQLGDFHQPYVARFPRTVELLRPGVHRFSLKVTSAQSGVELIWADTGTTASR
jgi:hypothetical protein